MSDHLAHENGEGQGPEQAELFGSVSPARCFCSAPFRTEDGLVLCTGGHVYAIASALDLRGPFFSTVSLNRIPDGVPQRRARQRPLRSPRGS